MNEKQKSGATRNKNNDILTFFRENHDQLMAIFDCIKVGIYVTDGEGTTLMVNQVSCETGGMQAEELIGRNMRDLVKDGYVSESVSLKAIASRSEESMVQQQGDGYKIYITGVPLEVNGEIQAVISTERDITETMKLREILEEKDRITKQYENELEYLRSKQAYIGSGIIAESKIMNHILGLANRISHWETTVLITGESGTGKEMIANYIYSNSLRKGKPFIRVNCSAIPENLIESELFGYERGAFTGAKQEGKPGYFELAHGGTLFLDEIGELPLQMQSTLLRAIQEKEILRLGGKQSIPVDVRILAATNRNLKKAISEGKFREDLFYRLNIIPIEIPPLRERRDDIMHLALEFADEFNLKYGQNKTISSGALKLLTNYEWPGNIRELRNMIERIVLTLDRNSITEDVIQNEIDPNRMEVPAAAGDMALSLSLQEQMDRFEAELLKKTLLQCNSAYEASKRLKINRSTISKKIRKYQIDYHR